MAIPLLPAGTSALDLFGVGANILGGLFSGKGKREKKAQELQQQALNVSRTDPSLRVIKNVQMAPITDKALYTLMARLGQTPSAFAPRDMFNPSTAAPSGGGIDFSKLAGDMAKFTPGKFVTEMDMDMLGSLLGALGLYSRKEAPTLKQTLRDRLMGRPIGPSGYNNPPAVATGVEVPPKRDVLSLRNPLSTPSSRVSSPFPRLRRF